jgi:uncharacterized YigZ family protein
MNDLPDSYETLDGSAAAEIKVKRSRFLAEAAPAADEPTARTVIDAVAHRYHDSRHVCYAWRLGYGDSIVEIRNDAGEPSGSAGKPILAAIRRTGLSNCVVVVARYFGGVKLGTGGLARAYGEVAATALSQAARRTVPLGRTYLLTFDYPRQKTVAKLLAAHQGRILDETYLTEVTWQIWLPHSQWRRFGAVLCEATAGTLTLTDK